MTDSEMIELAAKAAGYRLIGWRIALEGPSRQCAEVMDASHDTPIKWNPLDDDGDAFRLAVKLEIHITSSKTDAWASTPEVHAIQTMSGDPFSATRRAIVRVAAAIQQSKAAK